MSSKPSTWYEEERSRILYACEENYDGNMIMLVMVQEEKLKKVQAERDALMKIVHDVVGCSECVHEANPLEQPPCNGCGILGLNWKWRGIQEQKGSERA
jgi:hypothetical protein